ncbi:MAG: nitrate- and nitrite sensing domain-containing protein [Actinocatenispora sp.]
MVSLIWSGYLVGPAVYNRQVAASVLQVSIPAVTGLASVQAERQLSMQYLAQDHADLKTLVNQRENSDKQLSAMRRAAAEALAGAPASISSKMSALTQDLDQLQKIRSEIDSHSTTSQTVYRFYNHLLDDATSLFNTQARIVSDTTAMKGGIAATDIFRVSDLMSRARSIIARSYASGKLNQHDFLEFSNLVGAYHSALRTVTPDLRADVQAQSRILIGSDAWSQLSDAEQALIAHGPWTYGPPREISLTGTSWQSLTGQVSDGLTKMTVKQATEVSSEALDSADRQLGLAVGGSLAIFLVVGAAIFYAWRRARLLASEALTSRLANLRDEARYLVDEQLPRILQWLREGKQVDVERELPELRHGDDEIGQVALSFQRTIRVAVEGAVDMSRARERVRDVFIGIARRNQSPLQGGLNQLDEWQQRERNPQVMKLLFSLDHALNQIRKNYENMMYLANETPGRRHRDPVPLQNILRQAISETKQYARVQLEPVPDVKILGSVVGQTCHLIAELVDNALAFSKPEVDVEMRAEQVPAGLAVEVEDRGLGMSHEDRERINDALQNSPEFDLLELRDPSQLGLVVVAMLARKLGARVELKSTIYQGTRAIVLLPNELFASSDTRDRTPVLESPAEPLALAGQRRSTPAPLPAAPVTGETTTEFSTIGNGLGNGSGNGHASLASGWPESPSQGGLPRRHPQPYPPREPVGPGPHPTSSGSPMSPSRHGTMSQNRIVNGADPQTTSSSLPTVSSAPPARRAENSEVRHPLPERRPQQHMAPELRDTQLLGRHEQREPGAERADQRSAEEARSRYTAFQQGTRDGRQDSDRETS